MSNTIKSKEVSYFDLDKQYAPFTTATVTYENPIGLKEVVLYGDDGNSKSFTQEDIDVLEDKFYSSIIEELMCF
jgi:hypothetical protein